MHCLKCKHDLQGIYDGTCPRCGRGFDRTDPRTFGWKRPHRLRNILIVLLSLVAGWLIAFAYINSDPHATIDVGGAPARDTAEMPVPERVVYGLVWGSGIGVVVMPAAFYFAGLRKRRKEATSE